MKKFILTTLLIGLFAMLAFSQQLTQTVRGDIIDIDTKMPLIGAAVVISNSNPSIGTTTDVNGKFRLDNVPIGRLNLLLSYLGYETKTVPNVVVNSGKEVVLNLTMQESLLDIEEVVVKANLRKGEATNEMAMLSSRSISLEETSRYTGGMNDPSRVVSSFAGVTNTQEGSSDIIVRGNSPKYMQWRLDGVEITSPYHMDDQNASFGALTALNNNLLATSDFYTGAFSPEYGNVLSSVFDIKLRNGNNEKFEATAAIGLLGTDLTLEGPFKKGYGGSYLINYRYSTVSLVKDIGLLTDVEGVVNYQDATFKVVLPSQSIGTFSFFGLFGLSGFNIESAAPGNFSITGSVHQGNIIKDYDKTASLANIGLNHTINLKGNAYIKTSLSYSSNGIDDDIFDKEVILDNNEYIENPLSKKQQSFKSNLGNTSYRGAITYNNKINVNHKIQIGLKYSLNRHNYNQSMYNYTASRLINVNDFDEYASTLNNFVSWKYRINDDLTLVSGIHNFNVFLNNKSTIEPRIALNWKLNNTCSFHAGYGKHSTMEKIQNYYTKVILENGTITEPNKDMGLLKADHFVVGFEKRFSQNLMAKVEAYYQNLYDLPVENNDTSLYATINEGYYYQYVDLVNKGTGKNYGVELTLERFFDKNYYFLVNSSLFNSTYIALDGIERNTQYNSNYIVNILCGKEFVNLGKKHNKTLALNAKLFLGGGKKYIPLLRNEKGEVDVDIENNNFFDYSKAYENDLDDVFSLNFSVSYKINRAKSTHEIFLDLMNLTNNEARISEFYDESKPNKVGYIKQMFFFPNLMYRVYF